MATPVFARTGSGPTLVLLHGLGLSRRTWAPVVPVLSDHFDLLAVDLPGFGESEPLPPGTGPVPAALAAAVAGLLDDLGVESPHVAGNSLGGWVALELAGLRPTASVTLLSPAGLWAGATPLYCRISLRASRWLARHAAGLLRRLVGSRPGRVLVLGQTHGRPGRVTPEQARGVLRDMGTAPGFEATLRDTGPRRYLAGMPIDAPVTVAFGSRDHLLLRRQSRHLDQLPPGTRLTALPGCGHVPMTDDPVAVAAVITAATARAGSPVSERCAPLRSAPGGSPRGRGAR